MDLKGWLLLGHQLPARDSNARVKTWRRLRQIGAVPARNSVYVLPNTESCREDFEWIRSEIVALGGEATVFAADAISAGGTEEIVAVFQRTREQAFRRLKRDIDRIVGPTDGQRARVATRSRRQGAAIRVLRDRFAALERIDFFPTEVRDETAESLRALEESIPAPPPPSPPTPRTVAPLDTAGFQGRRWVTRPRPGVDRMASAWLIRRFIDRAASFAFLEHPGPSDVPFDMYTGDFSHQGTQCTFEVLADRFGLEGVAVTRIGRVVHDLDMKDVQYGDPEAPVVGRIVEGLQALHATDRTLLDQGIGVFEALARSFESDGTPAPPTPGRRKARATARRRP